MKKVLLLIAVVFTVLLATACDKKTYTVSFDSRGGSPVASVVVEKEATVTAPANPTKEGHTFTGWYLNEQLYNFSTPVTEDLVLYAGWNVNSYKIYFQPNGGVYADTNKAKSFTVQYGTDIPTVEEPTREGYVFGGWCVDSSCETLSTYTTMPAKDVELYAKWIPTICEVLLIVDDLQVSSVSAMTGHAIGDISYKPTKEGHTFAGWYYNNELVDSSFVVPGNIELHAKFTINQYSITFDTNGGSDVATITADYASKVTRPSNPTKEGHTFAGWYTDATLETPLDSFPTNMPVSGLALYAKWDVNEYKLTIDLNNGSELVEVLVPYGTSLNSYKPAEDPTSNAPFLGWTADGAAFDFTAATMPAHNLTIVAKYQGYTSITFQDATTVTGLEGSLIDVPEDPSKEGFEFKGWYLDDQYSQAFDLEVFPTDDLLVYAKWEQIYHTVTFVSANGSKTISVPYGTQLSQATNLPNLDVDGYTLEIKDANNNLIALSDVVVKSDVTINLNYIINTYTVQFIIDGKVYYAVSGQYGQAISFDGFVSKMKSDVVLLKGLYATILNIIATSGSAESIGAYGAYVQTNMALFAINDNISASILGFNGGTLGIDGFHGIIDAEISTLEGLVAGYELNKLSSGYAPYKSGYVFAGWALGENGVYVDAQGNEYHAGEVVGSIVPATTNGANTVNLVATFKKLATITEVEVTKESGSTTMSWEAVDTSFVNSATQNVSVSYDIYYYNGVEYVLLDTVSKNSYTFKSYGVYNIVIQTNVVITNKQGAVIKYLTSDIAQTAIEVIVEVDSLEVDFNETGGGDYYRTGTDKDGNNAFIFYTQNEYAFTHDGNNDGTPDFTFVITDADGNPTTSNVVTAKNHVLKIHNQIGSFFFTNGVNKDGNGKLKVFVAYVIPYVTQFSLDKELANYNDNKSDQSPFIDPEETIYTIGRFNADDLKVSNDPNGKNAHIYNNVLSYKNNGFSFNLAINTFGGNVIDYAAYGDYLTYEFYNVNSDNTIDFTRPISSANMGTYDVTTDSWSFTAPEGVYGVRISISKTYLAPKQIDDQLFPAVTFVFKLDNSINVFTHQQFKEVYANFSLGSSNVVDGYIVRGISLHSNIELTISNNQRYSETNTSNPGNNHYSDSEHTGKKDGSPINVSHTELLQYEGVEGFDSGNVYARVTAQEVKEIYTINGNLFTMNGQKLPFVSINSISNLSSISGYKIANVQIAILSYIVGDDQGGMGTGHLVVKDLQMIGNTSKPAFDSSNSASALEIMNRNSGGYCGITVRLGSSLTLENSIVTNTTIGVTNSHAVSRDGSYPVPVTTIKDTIIKSNWSNCIYGWNSASFDIYNSLIGDSGGAAIALQDTRSLATRPCGAYLKIDEKTVIENYVSGTEGYFKAYGMELVAMTVKGSLDDQLATITGTFANFGVTIPSYTIIKEVVDPVTQIASEKFNFVFMLTAAAENADATNPDYAHANLMNVYVPYVSYAHQILGAYGFTNEFNNVHGGSYNVVYLSKAFDGSPLGLPAIPYALAGLTVNPYYNGQGSEGLFMFTTAIPGQGNSFIGVGVNQK